MRHAGLLCALLLVTLGLSARSEEKAPTPGDGDGEKAEKAEKVEKAVEIAREAKAAAEAKAPDDQKPGAPKAAEAPRAGGLRLAAVVFTSGEKLAKVWVEEKPTGAWVIHEGKRYWYRKDDIAKIDYLSEEPDEALKRSLAQAEEARKKEEARTKTADAEREAKSAAEAAKAGDAPTPRKGGPEGGKTAGGDSATGSGKTAGGQTAVGEAGSKRGKTQGGGRTGVGTAGGLSGGGGDGIARVGNNRMLLANQWRVKWINRKQGLIRIKNRGLQRGVTLKVTDSESLKHVRTGQILVGALTVESPSLTAPDGTAIQFVLNPNETPAVVP